MSKAEEFIREHTRNCSNLMQVPILDDKGNIVPEAHPWLTPDQARRAVEIAREEMMEKACKFLDGQSFIPTYVINNLKQAMKDG